MDKPNTASQMAVEFCAQDAAFVAEFNRLSGCNFPNGGEYDFSQFTKFVNEFVLLPVLKSAWSPANDH